MSKVAISGNASGTGTFTIQAPNSNTDRVLSLPDEAGTVLTNSGYITADGTNLILKADGTNEDARIDSSGNLLVGKSAIDNTTDGFYANANGFGSVNTDARCATFVRKNSDGTIAEFRKDVSTVGSIKSADSARLVIDSAADGKLSRAGIELYSWTFGSFVPIPDNSRDLGGSASRWDDVYATNGTIQTSDRNEKQDIELLSEAEQRVAVACKSLIRKFRWKSAVAEKGDDARIHFGIIAQDLQAAFEAEGLDAGRYAMFISSTWWETYTDVPAVEEELDEEGNVVVEAKEAYTRTDTYETEEEAPEGAVKKSRMGVRYSELLAFIIGAL